MPTFGNPIVASPNMLPAFANVFSTSAEYNEGDHVWYAGKLYVFTAAHQGAWTGDDVSAIKLATEVAEMKATVDTINGSLDEFGANLEFESSTSMLYLLNRENERISEGIVISGGGGGGGGNNAILTITNTTGWLSKTISLGESCVLSFTWSSLEQEIPTGNGVLTVRADNVIKKRQDVAQGEVSVDVGEYLAAGANKVRLSISDVYENTKSINFTITAVVLSITSTFDPSGIFTAGQEIAFPYVPTGTAEKTVYFIVDGVQDGTQVVTVSGRQQTYMLSSMNHGAHSILVYFTAVIDEETVYSNSLYYDIIVADPQSNVPIISSTWTQTTVTQYETVAIPYRVYTPNSLTSNITLYADDTVVAELTVDRTEQTWSYRFYDMGDVELSIVCGITAKMWEFTVTESPIDIEPVSQDLSLFLTSAGRSNSELNPNVWEDVDNGIVCTMTGFNFVSDGWITDPDGVTVLRVSGDARVSVPYQAFASDFRGTGKTIEVEFATRNVLNYDAAIVSCMSGGRGFQLTAQKATLDSEQSEIYTQYKEDEHVRISFVVEKRAENRLILIYINGIMSGVVQYPDDDDFSQQTPVNISIGSNECTVDIYNIRVYDNDLTRYQILENWIADTQDISLMLERYEHNDVYNDYGDITIDKLPPDLPYLVMTCPELPQYKGDKKTISGYYVDPVNSSNSFTYAGAQADVQGTSSQYYPRKNYKIKFKNGFIMTESGETEGNYQMRPDSIATNTFTFKADVASSEGANNVELVRLYNATCTYRTPPQEENEDVRQGIDGFPIVIFWNDGVNVQFIGKYNFNNDKGTPEVFGFEEGDESWEILNNTSDRVLWMNDDFSGTAWLNDFEGRYPDGNEDPTNLSALSAWVVSTDQDAATGNALPSPYTDVDGVTHTVDNAAYRLAKFKTEFEQHLDKSSALYYYLFTELFLMVDSRAKNAFPSFFGTDKWCWLPYDMDTAIGTNNEGTLTFSYNLEDIDTLPGGAYVFNGQNSVMWVNLREAFPDDLQTMYRELRSTGAISYNVVEQMFENHQDKWPEAIFNEDSWFKYIDPLVDDGTASYLSMAQGSKAEQRKWWLYNRFRYIDSKYNAGDALSDLIQVRGYAKANITVTPYADIYPTIKYGSYLVSERGQRNVPTTLVNPLTTVNDTEIYIYSASQLASVGDLSGLKVGFADFSMATKLQSIKVGDSAAGYTNPNLEELYVGNNTLLNTVDARNCTALTQAVDLSGASNVEYVYFDGTAVTSVSLPNGGILKTLQLPETVTNLTVRNQPAMTTFTMPDYSNITTLRIENTPNIPIFAILDDMAANSRVRIIGFTVSMSTTEEVEDFYDLLDTMRGLDENGNNLDYAVASGTISGLGTITGAWLAGMYARYPNITIEYEHITSNLYYYSWDGSELLYTESIADGGIGTWTGIPSRPSDAQYNYYFAGWSLYTDQSVADPNATRNVTMDRSVYAAYTRVVRTYRVRFYNSNSALLQTVNDVPYGATAVYTGATPVHPTDPESYEFDYWNPSNENITGNTDCIAAYKYVGIITRKIIDRTIYGSYIRSDVTKIGSAAFAYCVSIAAVDFPEATEVGDYAFRGASSLSYISFPKCVTIGMRAFGNTRVSIASFPKCTSVGSSAFALCVYLENISFPICSSVGSYAFASCYSLAGSVEMPECVELGASAFLSCREITSVDFPKCVSIGDSAFEYCSKLTNISFPKCERITNRAFAQCSLIATADFPQCVSIGAYTFVNNYNLSLVSFPKCTYIGPYAFTRCSALTTLSFPECYEIRSYAFVSCFGLISLYLMGSNVCSLSHSNAFESTPIGGYSDVAGQYGSIFVPMSLAVAYQVSTNWAYYASRIVGV